MNFKAPLLGVIALATVYSAQAAIVMTISQVGNDVVLTGSGTLDLTGLVRDSRSYYGGSEIVVAEAVAIGGVYGTTYHAYSSDDMTAPANFGHNLGANAFGDGFGDFFGVRGSSVGAAIFVAEDYVSGTFLSGYSIFRGITLEELGFVAGDYKWTWSAGGVLQSFDVSVVAVPEPAHYAIGAGIAMLALVALRRRMK